MTGDILLAFAHEDKQFSHKIIAYDYKDLRQSFCPMKITAQNGSFEAAKIVEKPKAPHFEEQGDKDARAKKANKFSKTFFPGTKNINAVQQVGDKNREDDVDNVENMALLHAEERRDHRKKYKIKEGRQNPRNQVTQDFPAAFAGQTLT